MNYHHISRLIGFALAGASATIPTSVSTLWAADQAKPLVIAHRGGAALLPENTIPAFQHAVRLGVDMLEFDMVLTADDQIVIQHDPNVPNFCTTPPGSGVKPGPIRRLPLIDVLKFDCGSKHRATYPNQRAVPGAHMPTLDAFLAKFKNSKMLFFGETKMPKPADGTVDPVAFTRQVEAMVRKYGLEDRFILQSFDWRTIDAMDAINPRIGTCLLGVDRAKMDYIELARQHHAGCVVLRVQDTSATQVRQLRDAGVMVFSDVVDDEAGWRAGLSLGVDALFTNDPAALITFLKRDEAAN